MTTEYTPNFRFNMPDFRMGPWHDLVNTNTFRLDQILLAIYQGVDTAPWENNKLYTPGMTAIDLVDNSFWVCAFEHTSAPAPTTFAADRAAHPTFWIRTVVGITPRGQWQNATHYLVNDMVSDADQGVVAICITEHDSIAAPGTIRDDAAFWTFIVDMTGSGANQAAYIVYDNSTSGTTQTNLQGTTDEIYDRLSTIDSNIILIGTGLTDHETRIDALEVSDDAQNAAITTLQSNDTNQDIRLTAAEGTITGHETRISNLEADVANDLEDAPSDGEIYARQNATWVVVSGGGASVLVSDTPPVGADPNSLWWESDTGQLYILYDDGDTTQWVVAVPQLDAGSFVSKGGDTMTGNLAIAASNPLLHINKAASAEYAGIQGSKAGLARWFMFMGNSAAESGGDAGSDFGLNRYNDAGVLIDQPFAIRRSDGQATLNGQQIFANLPVKDIVGAYTFILSDAQKLIRQITTAGAITIPNNSSVAFAIGTVISFVPYGNATTITPASSVFLYWNNGTVLGGQGAAGNRSVGNVGLVSFVKVLADVWVMSGSGIT